MLFVLRMAADIPDHVRGVTVRPSVLADVYELAANLREADRDEVESLGMDVRVGIRNSFRHAVLRKTYLVDGEVAAMSGLCGSMLGDIGEPYLMTSAAAERVPLAFVKHAKASVAEMLGLKRRLEGHVAANYVRACRLLQVLGFTLHAPLPVGPKGALFRKYTMMRAG
jgi:hypothetical protein